MPAREDRLPPRTAPRGLTMFEAAAFAGLGPSDYKQACERGEYPRATLAGAAWTESSWSATWIT
jgi:hypothetical protein